MHVQFGDFLVHEQNRSMIEDIERLLLSPNNQDELIRYINNNSAAKECINMVLAKLVSNAAIFDVKNIEKARMLLLTGANPNYINYRGESLLQIAAYNGQGSLVELLIQHGADVLQYVPKMKIPRQDWIEFGLSDEEIDIKYAKEETRVAAMNTSEKIKEMSWQEKLPVQRAMKNLVNHKYDSNGQGVKACTILSNKSISALNNEKQLLETFQNQYKFLENLIRNAIEEATVSNKQLIIMIGERHTSLNSLIIELMVMLIANKYGIKTWLTEHNKHMEECVKKYNHIPTNEGKWSVSLTIYEQLESLSMNSIPVDLGHWGAKKIGPNYNDYEDLKKPNPDFHDTSIEGMRYREKIISDVISDGVKQSAILVVGSAHLEGLLEITPLPTERIHAICISSAERADLIAAAKERNEPSFRYPLESPKVQHPLPELEKFSAILSPETAVSYVLKTHAMLSAPRQATSSQAASNTASFFNKQEKADIGKIEAHDKLSI